MKDTRLYLRVPSDLKQWALRYARRRRTSVSEILQRRLEELRAQETQQATEEIVVHEL